MKDGLDAIEIEAAGRVLSQKNASALTSAMKNLLDVAIDAKILTVEALKLFSQPITENLQEGAVPLLSAEAISTFIGKISFDPKSSEAITGWNFNEINPDLDIHASDCYGLLIAAEELCLSKSDKLNIQLAISSKKNIIV